MRNKIFILILIIFCIKIGMTGCEKEHLGNEHDTLYMALKVDYVLKVNPKFVNINSDCRIQNMKVYIYAGSRLIKDMYWNYKFYESLEIPYQERYFDVYYFNIIKGTEIRILFEPEYEYNFSISSFENLFLYLEKNEFEFTANSDSCLTAQLEFINQDFSKIRVFQPYEKYPSNGMIDGDWIRWYIEYINVSEKYEYTYTNGDSALIFTHETAYASNHIDEVKISLKPDICYTIRTDNNFQILSIIEDSLSLK